MMRFGKRQSTWAVRAALLALLLPGALRAQGSPPPPPLPQPLRLPSGLVQTLAINKDASYFGDAVRIVDCPRDEDNPFGLCGNLLFGGLALMDSHLEGLIQIRFSQPFNSITHFEVSHPANLRGDDTVIKAPQFYEMAVSENFILDPFTQLSGGDLNLITGEVTNLNYRVLFTNSFYLALQNANPRLRGTPFQFPGGYGSAFAEFRQRPDGLLDFTFSGSTFLPLGKSILGDIVRMPLPFCGPLLQCGSIEAPGTSLHPHLRISTRAPAEPECGQNCPDIPSNAVRVFTAFSYSTTLGDNFALVAPELGGRGFARSHMTGRVHVQFGEKSGNFVPFVVSSIPPEALLAEPPAGGPAFLSLGMLGQSELLVFPRLTYFFGDVLTADDPFDIAVGHLNLRTGAVMGNFNYRSFFSQSIFQGLVALNPGLAPASQRFVGPLSFEKGVNGQTLLRFNGEIVVAFAGIVFPNPDLKTGFVTGPDSSLDLFLRLQAMHTTDPPQVTKTGSASNVRSSAGDTFSYSYSVPCNPLRGDASFRYTNNNSTKGGTFEMQSVASVSCINSRGSNSGPGDYDTLTFTGFGTWSKDSQPHAATVQVSTSPNSPYVHIMIDGGFTSQANTKPEEVPLP